MSNVDSAEKPLTSERFGSATDGWFSFDSPEVLLRSMPYPFFETPTTSDGIEQHTLTCFDVAALVLRDVVSKTFTPSIWPSESGLLSRRNREHLSGFKLASEPGEVYPLSAYQYLTNQESRSDQESAIIIGFHALRRITKLNTVTPSEAERMVHKKLIDLQDKGLPLDGQVKPLVVHYVSTDYQYVGGEHIGLLIQRDDECLYLEKNGPSGPFVLLKTNQHKPIIDYVAGHYDRAFCSESHPELVGSIMVITLGSEIMLSKSYRSPKKLGERRN